jgi:hypothetical protein
MEWIVVSKQRIYFDPRIQTGKEGRKFEMSGTYQVLNEPPIWNNKKREYSHWWIDRFTYLDNREEYFEIKTNDMSMERYFRTKDKEWKIIT